MIGKFAYLVHFLCNLHWILIWLDILGCFGGNLAALVGQNHFWKVLESCWKNCEVLILLRALDSNLVNWVLCILKKLFLCVVVLILIILELFLPCLNCLNIFWNKLLKLEKFCEVHCWNNLLVFITVACVLEDIANCFNWIN